MTRPVLNTFRFSKFLGYSILILFSLIIISCNESPQNEGETQVDDWKIPCDLSKLCPLKELLSSLNGPSEFKGQLRAKIVENPKQYHDFYGDSYFYICAKLIESGGCTGLDIKSVSELELFMKGLASCHHFRCHDYYQKNKTNLLELIEIKKSKTSLKLYYLMAIKLPLSWFEKAPFLAKYLKLIDGPVIRYEDLGPLISAIPNHQGLKSYVAKNFFKIDKHLDGIAVYLARYQNGWHDIYYKKFLDSENHVAQKAFISTMPISCPKVATTVSFKTFFNESNKRLLSETLRQEQLDKYFKKLNVKQNINSKCFSSSQPAF